MHSLKSIDTILSPHLGATVHYRIAVVDGVTGREVSRQPRKRNLILDNGLDMIATVRINQCFNYAVIGTGTTPTKRDSGAVTVSQAGSTLTASEGFFVADDVGRLFKADTGEERRITVYSSATSVETSTAGDFAASEGTVWYVNQAALTTESKRTTTKISGASNNGTTYAGATITMKRTFLFSAESATVNYREIGWSNTGTSGANLFGRDLLAGSGVTLISGQQLKVVVELSITVGPVGPVAWANVIGGGFGGDGTCGVECIGASAIQIVSSSGGEGSASFGVLEAGSGGKTMAVVSNADALQAPTTGGKIIAVYGWTKDLTANAYAPGSFTRSYSGIYAVTEINSSALRSLVLGTGGSSDMTSCFRILLDAAATKDVDHTLSLTFSISWGRILTN